MKGIWFYLEHDSPAHKRRNEHTGTVLAVGVPFQGDENVGAFGSVLDEPDSPVASTMVSREYLYLRCKRISEKRAREIHPALFERLDNCES